jgi:hypothetical protein
MNRQPLRILAGLTVLLIAAGCTSTTSSNTARTAKEQMLLSNAVDQSLDKVDFTPLYGRSVFVEDKYLECTDKGYVLGSMRHRIMRAGGTLAAAADSADVVLELRSGGVGTDSTDAFVGSPEVVLPGMLTLPEVRLLEKRAQYGYAKLAIVAYDAKTREPLGDGGMSMARADDSNWNVLGVGPFQNGSLRKEIERGQKVPMGTYQRQMPMTVALGTGRKSSPDSESDTTRFASESKELGETESETEQK